MTLSTSFTLEELHYLKGLPEINFGGPCESLNPERLRAIQEGWFTRTNSGVKEISGCLAMGCDMYGHWHEGIYYYRHGEMLAKFPCDWPATPLPEGLSPQLHAWIDSIHAHELATTP